MNPQFLNALATITFAPQDQSKAKRVRCEQAVELTLAQLAQLPWLLRFGTKSLTHVFLMHAWVAGRGNSFMQQSQEQKQSVVNRWRTSTFAFRHDYLSMLEGLLWFFYLRK